MLDSHSHGNGRWPPAWGQPQPRDAPSPVTPPQGQGGMLHVTQMPAQRELCARFWACLSCPTHELFSEGHRAPRAGAQQRAAPHWPFQLNKIPGDSSPGLEQDVGASANDGASAHPSPVGISDHVWSCSAGTRISCPPLPASG